MKPAWKPIKVKLGQIRAWDKNPRMSTKAQAQRIIASERKFGQPVPFLISPDFLLYDGHQRLAAWFTVYGADYEMDAMQSDRPLSEDEHKELVITLHTGATGSWNWDALSGWSAGDLQEWGMTKDVVKDWSNDIQNLKELLAAEVEPVDAEPQTDRAGELAEKWQTASGQLWKLGDHRLLIGDCTVRENVERLMGGERARLCFTSPPYGNARDYEIGEFDFMDLYNKFSENAFLYCDDVLINLGLIHKDGAVFRYWEPWLDYCKSIGHELFGWYVWDQGSGMPGDFHGRLARSHEWIFHFSEKHLTANKWIKTSGESEKRGTDGKRFRQKDGSLKELGSPETIGQPFKVPDSVVRIGREMARGVHTESHPAVFPPALPEFGINTWSVKGDCVYEPFAGSGTTIIAAHNLNRRCFAMEISEKYSAVILERYFTATGITPELIG